MKIPLHLDLIILYVSYIIKSHKTFIWVIAFLRASKWLCNKKKKKLSVMCCLKTPRMHRNVHRNMLIPSSLHGALGLQNYTFIPRRYVFFTSLFIYLFILGHSCLPNSVKTVIRSVPFYACLDHELGALSKKFVK